MLGQNIQSAIYLRSRRCRCLKKSRQACLRGIPRHFPSRSLVRDKQELERRLREELTLSNFVAASLNQCGLDTGDPILAELGICCIDRLARKASNAAISLVARSWRRSRINETRLTVLTRIAYAFLREDNLRKGLVDRTKIFDEIQDLAFERLACRYSLTFKQHKRSPGLALTPKCVCCGAARIDCF